MDIATIVQTLTPMVDAFEVLGTPYHLTGSLAISVYVNTQVVQEIEVVADIKFSQVQALSVRLEKIFDITEVAIRTAIQQRGSFSLVQQATLRKIEVLLPAYHAYSQVRQERAQRHSLEQGSRSFPFASPEDMVLMLLEQYKGGGQPIRRVWDTILEILRAQRVLLDLVYLRVWATALDVAPLLEHALVSAGLTSA